jgi:DNA-binding transcriptional MerR regulator
LLKVEVEVKALQILLKENRVSIENVRRLMQLKQQGFSISDVSIRFEIPKPTLRFWEKEFKEILVPLRTQGGQRRYNIEHLAVIKKIKRLQGRGMSLSKIRGNLMRDRKKKESDLNNTNIDFLADRIAKVVRDEVYRFLEKEGKEPVNYDRC